MTIRTIPTTPFEGQKPGTSGLRKKVAEMTIEPLKFGEIQPQVARSMYSTCRSCSFSQT